MVVGGVTGVVSMGIGSVSIGSMGSFGGAMFHAGMHAIRNGLTDVISNGGDWSKFGSGFVSGLVSALVTQGVDELGIKNWEIPEFREATLLAVGGMSGGLSSSITGGSFKDGFTQGLISTGFNYLHGKFFTKALSEGEEGSDLDKFARRKFGDDYKTKYGVKSLKWASELGDEEREKYGVFYGKEVGNILYKAKDGSIQSATGWTRPDGEGVFISDYLKTTNVPFLLQSTIGHEFIHSYHLMTFGSSFVKDYSEYEAYRYSYELTKLEHFKGVVESLQKQKLYDASGRYDYKKIPGF